MQIIDGVFSTIFTKSRQSIFLKTTPIPVKEHQLFYKKNLHFEKNQKKQLFSPFRVTFSTSIRHPINESR